MQTPVAPGAQATPTGGQSLRLSNAFSLDAVKGWSERRRRAWRHRQTQPDGFLLRSPAPGQRLATGPFTDDEAAVFERRLHEFRARGWPLHYWGLFSVALPSRTGLQCAAFYRASPWLRPGEENFDTPLAAVASCLAHHSAQLQALWASPAAQRVAQQVDLWLSELPPGRNSTTPASAVAKSASPAVRLPPTSAGPRLLSSIEESAGRAGSGGSAGGWSSAAGSRASRLRLAAAGDALPYGARPPVHAAPGMPPGAANTPVPPSAPAARPKPAAGVLQSRPAAAQPRAVAKATSKHSSESKPVGSVKRPLDDGDSDDEFINGTLKQVSARFAATASKKKPKAAAATPAKPGGPAAPRRKAGAAIAAGRDALSGLGAAGDGVAVIRLQRDKEAPGWARQVAPYAPLQARTAAAASPDRRVLHVPSILSFDFASLGAGFLGVIVNAPLVDSTDGAGGGVTPAQLASLRLPDCLAEDAIVCVWARKRRVAQAARLMAAAWGCKYVENLTWVELDPGGVVARGPSAPGDLIAASHLTLVMGRRGGGDLELRHQRTADVLVHPAMGGGRFPDAARAMLETLLRGAAVGGAAPTAHGPEVLAEDSGGGGAEVAAAGRPLRLLEVAFQGAEAGGRAGWVTLAQAKPP